MNRILSIQEEKKPLGMDLTIRENNNGKYLIIHAHQFREGIAYADKAKVPQIQLRGVIGKENSDAVVDFKEIEKLSKTLKVISFTSEFNMVKNLVNFNSIYTLQNLEKIYIQEKEKFTIDVSLFPKLQHLGAEYWKGLINFNKSKSLTSLVLIKFPDSDLSRISELINLEILHIYSSKIRTLEGIENFSKLKELMLARNNLLEDIKMIANIKSLTRLNIEKCDKIKDYSFIENYKKISIGFRI